MRSPNLDGADGDIKCQDNVVMDVCACAAAGSMPAKPATTTYCETDLWVSDFIIDPALDASETWQSGRSPVRHA